MGSIPTFFSYFHLKSVNLKLVTKLHMLILNVKPAASFRQVGTGTTTHWENMFGNFALESIILSRDSENKHKICLYC